VTKRRVLIIDDEKDLCDFAKLYLEKKAQYEVEILTDSQDALSTAKSFHPDIVVLDLRMPHVGGFEVMELLNSDKDTQNIPVIVSTALADKADVKKAYRLGASGYIVKPMEFSDLAVEIERVLSE
jgi:DNA-binding response OmpR family regulator